MHRDCFEWRCMKIVAMKVSIMKAKTTGWTHDINTQRRPIDSKHYPDFSSPTASSTYQEMWSLRWWLCRTRSWTIIELSLLASMFVSAVWKDSTTLGNLQTSTRIKIMYMQHSGGGAMELLAVTIFNDSTECGVENNWAFGFGEWVC